MSRLCKLRPNFFSKLPCHIGIFGGVLGQLFQWDCRDIQVLGGFGFCSKREKIVAARILLRALRCGDVGQLDRRIVQQNFRQIIHRVPAIGGDENVGLHRVKEGPNDFNAVVVKHSEIVFEIVSDLFGTVAEERTKLGL